MLSQQNHNESPCVQVQEGSLGGLTQQRQMARLLAWRGSHMARLWLRVILEGTTYVPYFPLRPKVRNASGHTPAFAKP